MAETPDFFQKGETETAEPEEKDERWRLSEMYGAGADRSSLRKGEAVRKKKAKDEEIREQLKKLRKKLGIHRAGDQEEFGFEEKK